MVNSRRMFFTTCLALLTGLVMARGVAAAPYEIRFHSGTVTPADGVYEIPAVSAQTADKDHVHALVQLSDYLHAGERQALKNAGIVLLSYLPDRAYVASVPTNLDAGTATGLGIRHVSAMLPVYKLHSRVIAKELGKWSEYSNSRHVFAVDIMPDVSLGDARKALRQAGCELGNSFDVAHSVVAAFDPDRAVDIAGLDVVLFINEITPPLGMMNDVTRAHLHVNEVQAAPYNLDGQGTTILVFDGGMVDSTHPDFGDRVTWNETGTVLDHSTHVSGTAGGSGQASGGTYRGMAPMTRIISGKYDVATNPIFYNNPGDFESDYRRARTTFHIEETTNSIGVNIEANGYPCEWFGDYELCERTLDALTRDTEGSPLTMFFAAGNDRNGATCGMNYFSMSVPACAKNVISIGSTNASDVVSSWSCAGPTDDGRIKPEVCSRGEVLTSTVPGGGYGQMQGTSMACPGAAGVGLLIHQKWHQLFPGAPDPLPATVKAILINSTTDVGAANVDYLTGFGLVNALKAIQNMDAGGFLESALETDEDFTHEFTVTSGLAALDVSLAWSDVPAVGNVIPTLVNDLDLRLVDPSGTGYLPWVLRANAPSVPAGTGRDSINVCERVHVANPAAGTWTLHVTGHLNGSDAQSFGLSANVTLVSTWASINGQVRNAANQQGLPGNVSIAGSSQVTNTDSAGNYLMAVPGNAQYTVHAVSYGFVPQDAQVNVTNGSTTQNFALNAAQMGTIQGTVTNQFGTPLQAIVRFAFPNTTIPPVNCDVAGHFTSQLPGANYYDVTVDFFGNQYSARVLVPENGTVTHDFVITDMHYAPAGPDSFGYRAFETGDPGTPAVYDWLEISPQAGGAGTPITGTTPPNDWVTNVNLPFTMRFYGRDNTLLEVGADGWIGVGPVSYNTRCFVNQPIPTDSIPNGIIALFWDDLNPLPTGQGDISYYHDAAHGRFIVEYHGVSHYTPLTHHVTAQLVIWNQAARPTITGDNEFQIQYQSVDYSDSSATDADATVGIENYSGTDGLQIVYGGGYDPQCFPLGPQYALRFTTGAVTGYGTVSGHVTMVPPVADITQVAITFGPFSAHPNSNGNFLVDSVYANSYVAHATYAGYEMGADTFALLPDSTVNLSFRLFRLDPARNLAGQYVSETQDVHLNWDRPLCLIGGSPLDAFAGYEVWRIGVGTPVATVTDTFYTYHVPQSGNYNFWIVSAYGGGRSDTSNHYRVTINLSAGENSREIPTTFYLKQNYPNPFNPTTRIEYGLPKAAGVSLEVFDILGRTVAVLEQGTQEAGIHTVSFDGKNLGSGIYYYRLKAGDFVQIQKMLLMR